MTDPQKLATLIFRIAGASLAALVTLGLSILGVETALGISVQTYPAHTVITNIGYIVIGLLLVLFSKPLGKLFGRGIE